LAQPGDDVIGARPTELVREKCLQYPAVSADRSAASAIEASMLTMPRVCASTVKWLSESQAIALDHEQSIRSATNCCFPAPGANTHRAERAGPNYVLTNRSLFALAVSTIAIPHAR